MNEGTSLKRQVCAAIRSGAANIYIGEWQRYIVRVQSFEIDDVKLTNMAITLITDYVRPRPTRSRVVAAIQGKNELLTMGKAFYDYYILKLK